MTVGYGLLYHLFRVLGINDSVMDADGVMRFRRKAGSAPLAESDATPMFEFYAGYLNTDSRPRFAKLGRKNKVTWLSDGFRNDELPVPENTMHASQMALALAENAKAFAVYTVARSRTFTHFALADFRLLKSLEPTATRDKQMRHETRYTLRALKEELIKGVQLHGSGAAQQLGRHVAAHAQYLRTCCEIAALGDELRQDIEELAKALDSAAVRASIPTDEALRVAAELDSLWPGV